MESRATPAAGPAKPNVINAAWNGLLKVAVFITAIAAEPPSAATSVAALPAARGLSLNQTPKSSGSNIESVIVPNPALARSDAEHWTRLVSSGPAGVKGRKGELYRLYAHHAAHRTTTGTRPTETTPNTGLSAPTPTRFNTASTMMMTASAAPAACSTPTPDSSHAPLGPNPERAIKADSRRHQCTPPGAPAGLVATNSEGSSVKTEFYDPSTVGPGLAASCCRSVSLPGNRVPSPGKNGVVRLQSVLGFRPRPGPVFPVGAASK